MKSTKTIRTQYERSRKSNKRSEKSAKLDRKSSRGMIYENEELRLRTININAEVERGQSDIKRLRRENEQLRREIWTLRDECDRLNKRFKAQRNEHDFGGCRGSGGSGGACNAHRCSGGGRGSGGCDANSDDSDSCDTCRCDDGQCSDECCQDGGSCVPIKAPLQEGNGGNCDTVCNATLKADNQPLHFDHLSVVSEETLSNPEFLAQQNDHQQMCTVDPNGSQSTLPSLVGPLTPLTPIELVANQLNDLQAMVPPLSYFEKVLQQHMGSSMAVTPTPELGTNSSTTTGKTMRHTNGWDYNLQSPFTQRKYSANTSPARSPPPQMAAPTLTTFVPTPSVHSVPKIGGGMNVPPPLPPAVTSADAGTAIETVAITTNATQQALNSPKHFFAPIKPRLKLNTKLANQDDEQETLSPPLETPLIREPPDIFVNNALASPYQRQPPRFSPQVSPRHRAHTHCSHSQQHLAYQAKTPPQHCHVHQPRAQQQSQLEQLPAKHCALQRAIVNVAATVGLGGDGLGRVGGACSVVDIYTAALASAAVASASATHKDANNSNNPSTASLLPLPPPMTQASEPIYATAQKPCQSTCIPAIALTKAVMSATANSNPKATTSPLRQLLTKPMTCASVYSVTATSSPTNRTIDNGSQTDSDNLESILNDIETISEDILAIQLEKSKSRDNLTTSRNKNADDKMKKPYRSEMNLYVQYDGTNSMISPATTAATTTTNTTTATVNGTDGSKIARRTRSLEREHTDSPAPQMPDPMAPFPDKCTYLGFEQINQVAAKQPSVQRPQTKAPPPPVVKPNLPAKPPPPMPPARLNARTTPSQPPPPPPVSSTGTPPTYGLSPNKSHLYKSLATAAAKRAIFRSTPSQQTRSLDMECTMNGSAVNAAGDAGTATSTNEVGEAAKRKARRVSIVCAEEQISIANALDESGIELISAAPTTTASCGDLTLAASVVAHPTIKNVKQLSHSTPSSPHSARRQTNSNTMTAGHAELTATASAPASTTHHHHRKEGSDPVPLTATVNRTRCSRRHSEGTVHNAHRISNASGGTGTGHHHHHAHHHQHSSSVISNNPHHSHHSHQDSNHETFTSLSDRNSNSFASSRESSTSFSMRSNRRKISISSHTGGKIPWCGCWGNGCL